jgi:hypothetical protein
MRRTLAPEALYEDGPGGTFDRYYLRWHGPEPYAAAIGADRARRREAAASSANDRAGALLREIEEQNREAQR